MLVQNVQEEWASCDISVETSDWLQDGLAFRFPAFTEMFKVLQWRLGEMHSLQGFLTHE